MFDMLQRLRRQPASGRPSQATGGVVLLTFPKAGSQWVRDLLTHHLVLHRSGYVNAQVSADVERGDVWPQQPARSVVGPIYRATPEQWRTHSAPGDKAIVVLRDPRDMIVSWHYSQSFSHISTPANDRMRAALLSLTPSQRLLVCVNWFHRSSRAFEAWAASGFGAADSCYVTSYERLIADTRGQLGAMFDFLGWSVSSEDAARIVNDLSFENRAGRRAGEEDVFSHFRKGIAGEWRTHFDRACGIAFESQFPNVLQKAGYEDDPLWFEKLPGRAQDGLDAPPPDRLLKQAVELQAEVVRLREQARWLTEARDQRARERGQAGGGEA